MGDRRIQEREKDCEMTGNGCCAGGGTVGVGWTWPGWSLDCGLEVGGVEG